MNRMCHLFISLMFHQMHGIPLPDTRIVGGTPVSIVNFPHQVSLRVNGNHICGASIISPSWALTAGHCVHQKSAIVLSIRAGSGVRLSGGTTHLVLRSVVHQDYNPGTTDNDIALLKVSPDFFMSNSVKAIPLPVQDESVPDKAMATVSGWGYTLPYVQMAPVELRAVNVTIVNQSQCQKVWGSKLTSRMICAQGNFYGGTGACNGDSGGPLTSGGKQIGIVSFGSPCARPLIPDVYTRVAYFRTWIQTTTGA